MPGYGLAVANSRILGFDDKWTLIILRLPFWFLYLYVLLVSFNNLSSPLAPIVPLAIIPADSLVTLLLRPLTERVLRNKSPKTVEELVVKKDFEIRKGDISAISLRNPYVTKGILGGEKTSVEGYIAITPKDHMKREIIVKILGTEQFQQIVQLARKILRRNAGNTAIRITLVAGLG